MKESESLYDLQYNYIQQGGNFIAFSRESELCGEDLTLLQVQMLQFNEIPCLLPFEKDEMNGTVRLLYRFTNRRMLTHEIRSNPLSIKDYYKMIMKIISILNDSKMYMLNEEKYILHEDFIFIGKDYSDIHLCYLPLQTLEGKESVQEGLSTLALNLMASIQEIKGNGFQEFIKKVRDPNCSLYDLKQQLNKLIDEELECDEPISPKLSKLSKPAEPVEPAEPAEPNIPPKTLKPAEPFKPLNHETHKPLNPHRSAKPPITAEKSRNILYIIALLFIGVVITIYYNYPSEGMLYIGMGLTVLIIDAAYVAGKLWKPNKEQTLNAALPGNSEASSNMMSPAQYYKDLSNHTSMLKKSDATVFLNNEMNSENQEIEKVAKSIKAHIEVDTGGMAKRIDVQGERFVIGRDATEAHYRVDSIGVSRIHCEIIQREGEWGIKDLGSGNGSYLNDEVLIPYKLNPLHDGDKIKVVRNEFVFRMQV